MVVDQYLHNLLGDEKDENQFTLAILMFRGTGFTSGFFSMNSVGTAPHRSTCPPPGCHASMPRLARAAPEAPPTSATAEHGGAWRDEMPMRSPDPHQNTIRTYTLW